MRSQTERMYFAAEKLLVVGALLYFMGAIILVVKDPDHAVVQAQVSDSLTMILQLVIYAGAAIFIIPNRARVLKALAANPVFSSFLLLVLLSTIWSAAPFFTLRQAIWFMLTTAFGMYFATRFNLNEQLRLVTSALAVCAILSVFFIMALPHYGTDVLYNGAWRGVFLHKNALGLYMVIAIISFLCLRPETNLELVAKYSGLALSVCLLLGSRSAGSYVVMLASILLIFLYRLLHNNWKRLIPAATIAFTVLGIAATYVISNADSILRSLGKDATLTGRIPLWTILLAMSSSKSWLGYGFAGFWATKTYSVWALVSWKPHKAHNGFLDILLELGIVGLSIFALNTAITLWRSMKLVVRAKTLESQWPLLMLSLILLYSLFEVDPTLPNNFMWVAYVAITVSAQQAWSASRSMVRTAEPETVAPARFSASEYEPCPQ